MNSYIFILIFAFVFVFIIFGCHGCGHSIRRTDANSCDGHGILWRIDSGVDLETENKDHLLSLLHLQVIVMTNACSHTTSKYSVWRFFVYVQSTIVRADVYRVATGHQRKSFYSRVPSSSSSPNPPLPHSPHLSPPLFSPFKGKTSSISFSSFT